MRVGVGLRWLAFLLLLVFDSLIPVSATWASCMTEAELPPGGLSWPADGTVIRGWSLDCATDRGHRGIDIALSPGDPIRAAATGIVVFSGYTPAEGGGMTISIDHPGGLRSTYIHVDESTVATGDAVAAGQTLGLAGATALHFGLKSSGASTDRYLDPEAYLPPLPEEHEVTTKKDDASEPIPEETQHVGPAGTTVLSEMPDPVAAAEPQATATAATAAPSADFRVEAEVDARIVHPQTSTTGETLTVNREEELSSPQISAGAAWRPVAMPRLPAPVGFRPVVLLAADASSLPKWTIWLRRGMEKPAGAGLSVSTLVLSAIRRFVWAPRQWREVRAGSA